MKNIIIFLILVTSLTFGLVGCNANETTTKEKDGKTSQKVESSEKVESKEVETAKSQEEKIKSEEEVEENIKKYIKDISQIIVGIDTFGQELAQLQLQHKNGEITESEFVQVVKDHILPTATQLKADSEVVLPPPELKEAHDMLIEMLEKYVQAFSDMVSAIETEDEDKIDSAGKLIMEGNILQNQWGLKIQEVIQAHNVSFE
jgi:hypothetical protein